MPERDALRDSLQAELAVTRRLLAGMAAAATVLAIHGSLTAEQVPEVLGHLVKDSRLDQSAAEAAIAYLVVQLAQDR